MGIPEHPAWMPMRSVALLMLSVLASTVTADVAAENAPRGIYFQHHDWLLACDNTRTCRATGYAIDDGSTVSVLLERAGGPGTPVTGRVSLEPADDQPVPGDALFLHLKQDDAGALAAADDQGHRALSAAQVSALLTVLVRGGRVEIVDNDTNIWEISERGAAAVLLKMDEYQGRLGTPGALMRKGSRAEAQVPPALPVPVLQRVVTLGETAPTAPHADSPQLRAALRASLGNKECSALQNDDVEATAAPMRFVRVDAHHVLVSLDCWMGAYNAGEGYWLLADNAPLAPVLVTLDANSYYDGEISASHKGRGLGDCWSQARWNWDGTRFAHAYEGTTGLCRSVTGGTWQLPTHVTELRDP